jgi:hypothetical protein
MLAIATIPMVSSSDFLRRGFDDRRDPRRRHLSARSEASLVDPLPVGSLAIGIARYVYGTREKLRSSTAHVPPSSRETKTPLPKTVTSTVPGACAGTAIP